MCVCHLFVNEESSDSRRLSPIQSFVPPDVTRAVWNEWQLRLKLDQFHLLCICCDSVVVSPFFQRLRKYLWCTTRWAWRKLRLVCICSSYYSSRLYVSTRCCISIHSYISAWYNVDFEPSHLGNHWADFDEIGNFLLPSEGHTVPTCLYLVFWYDNVGGAGDYPVFHCKVFLCLFFGLLGITCTCSTNGSILSICTSHDVFPRKHLPFWGFVDISQKCQILQDPNFETWYMFSCQMREISKLL